MKRWSQWWYRSVSGRVVAVATLGFLVFGALVLPAQAERTDVYAGDCRTPDTSLIYAPSDLEEAAECFGDEGREEYVVARATFDVIWPLVYGSFLCVALTALLRRLLADGSPLRLLNLAPWIGVAIDYVENLLTSIVMIRWPDPTPVAAALAPAATFTKWIFVGGSFLAVLVLVVPALVIPRRRGTL
jgi:hypothetical protein